MAYSGSFHWANIERFFLTSSLDARLRPKIVVNFAFKYCPRIYFVALFVVSSLFDFSSRLKIFPSSLLIIVIEKSFIKEPQFVLPID
jgi:hypothetical protein